jgi:hypothetical protein
MLSLRYTCKFLSLSSLSLFSLSLLSLPVTLSISLPPSLSMLVIQLTSCCSILSPHSHTQNHAFAAALLFAQDYGILAASVEDRPFVPVTTVVLEGAPRDMKAVFRRWTEVGNVGKLPTERLMAGKALKRGGSIRVVGLAAALAAVQR